MSRVALAQALLSSPEGEGQRVEDFYGTFLHRSADAGGFQYFWSGLEQGMSDELVIAALAGSEEYFDRL